MVSAEHGASFISIVTVVFMKSAVENVSVIDKFKKKKSSMEIFQHIFKGRLSGLWFL